MRLTIPFSFLRASRAAAGTTVVAGALLLGATLGIGTGHAQPTPTPPPPQKPLPTLYQPQLRNSRDGGATTFPVVTTTDKQSPVNPFPFGAGNAQARGVGGADMYWGMVNANVRYDQITASRVPSASVSNNSLRNFPLELDGWTFTAGLRGFDPNAAATEQRDARANDPRSGTRNGVFLNQTAPVVTDDDAVRASSATPPPNSPAVLALWLSVNAPSQGFQGGGYSRAPAVTRPNTPALDYVTANLANNPHGFRYQFNDPTVASTQIPGASGEQARLRITVGVPAQSDDEAAAITEARVSDARYLVFYYIRTTAGLILPKVKVFNVSQTGGDQLLVNADGSPAVFPFFSAATNISGFDPQPGLGIPFQGVIVDDTTTDVNTSAGTQYVLADRLTLTGGTGTISVTPTVVGPHGGRKNANYNVVTDVAGVPVLPGPVPGTQPQQPRAFVPRLGVPYSNQILNEPLVKPGTTTVALTNESYTDTNAATGMPDAANTPGYINNPRDPAYNTPAPAMGAFDGRIPFESWNPSTLFMGPEALLDPRRRTNPNSSTEVAIPLRLGTGNRPRIARTNPATGAAITELVPGGGGATRAFRTPANASDANNFNVYGGAFGANSTNWTPYFSQMQVIVARTEFVPNPETNVPDALKDGTLTIQVGAVYSLDWQTGAPIWRFPDKTYLPGRARNPRIFTGNPTSTDPAQRQDVYLVPNIVVVDSNTNGSSTAIDPAIANPLHTLNDNDINIEDEEVFIGQLTGSAAVTTGATSTLGVGAGSGALFASITFAPRVPVQGRVQLPTYRIATPPVLTQFNRTGRYIQTNDGTSVDAPPGRYYTHDTGSRVPYDGDASDSRGALNSVLTGMLYIAANNGVIYAVDAFGNNDNYYAPYHPNLAAPNTIDNGVFGNYQPGTTNVLWTFSPTSGGRRRNESLAAYYARLKGEVPATSGFGASAPVLAYAKDEHDNTSATAAERIEPFTDELRLFAGNSNGVLYAMDASAKAGTETVFVGGVAITTLRSLPFRKGDQVGFVPNNGTGANPVPSPLAQATYRTDLKWWFRTRAGAINYPPTVSLMKQKAGQAPTDGGTVPFTKGVYVSSQEGRVYCVDFFGPVTRGNHSTPVATPTGWDGTSGAVGSVAPGSAAALNDDFYFHNTVAATATAQADQTEGTVRPRWAWPNLYRNTQATVRTVIVTPDFGVSNDSRQFDAYDDATRVPITVTASTPLGVPEALGTPTSSPVLMDFFWKDPLVLTAGAKLRSYVAVVMNDPTAVGEAVTASRVYLLDQIGDRANFLSGTQVNKTGASASPAVRGAFVDRWTPGALLSDGDVNGLTPTGIAWSYRTQYDVFPGNSPTLQDPLTNPADLSGRNSPTSDPTVLSTIPTAFPDLGGANAFTGTSAAYPHYRDENYGRPERRTLPTLFVGGSTGDVYGLDIDPETGIFLRWRPTLAESRRFSVLPVSPFLTNAGVGVGDNLFPGPEANGDLRPTPIGTLTQYDDPFTGGTRPALRNRRVLARSMRLVSEDASAVANLTISGGPLQNRNNRTPVAGTATAPTNPTVPTLPTNDAPLLRPFLLSTNANDAAPVSSYDPDIYSAAQSDVRQFALSSRTNQDINDPITTHRASVYSDVPPGPTRTRFIQAETTQRFFNQAYQYPGIFVTTTGGFLHEISSNIEGEDFSTVATINESSAVGWGLQGLGALETRFNTGTHVRQFIQNLGGGSAGPVSGVAVVTPAYFPALDPSFTNPQRVAAPASTPADNFRNYPYGSPNIIGAPGVAATPPVPVGVTTGNNDDPRPDFHVRPLSPGAVTQPGPDGMLGTPDDVVAVLPDRHTGQTGFPLDLNGLFFDKRFAGNGTRALPTPEVGPTVYNESFIEAQAQAPNTPIVAPGTYTGAYPYPPLDGVFAGTPPPVRDVFAGQDPNGDYTVYLRLPAYSDIGTALDTETTPVARLFNNQQADGLRANRRTGNLVPLATEAVTERSLELPYGNDPANNLTRGDDINPAGQNVTWIFTGGANGIFYAFTPAIPGQSSGFGGGQPEYAPNIPGSPAGFNPLGGQQIDLYDEATYNSLRTAATTSATLTPPDRKQSIAGKGGRNFYEWGETAYIVVSNFLVGRDQNPSDPNSSLPVTVGSNISVHVTIKSRFGGPTVYDGDINPLRYMGNYSSYSVTEDDGSITRYGIAALPFRLDRPTSAKPLTPGDVYEISAVVNQGNSADFVVGGIAGSVGGEGAGNGSNSVIQAQNSPAAFLSIANPIAVQAFGVETGPSPVTGQVMPVGVKHKVGETAGGIGPFFADNNQAGTGNGTKGEVVDSQTTSSPKPLPNEIGGRYSQALTQGNLMRRRELSAILPDSSTTGFRLNPRFPQILKDATGGDEPRFYLPVASGVGYIDHGTSGSTTKGNIQLLRVANRSVLQSLPDIRIQAVDPLLWHAWPGQVPNTEGDLPALGGNPALVHNNPRLTPVGMDPYGRINPLPWETGVNENEPYNAGSLANQSPDYPDIILQRTTSAPRVFIGGTDVSNGTGALPANITISGSSRANTGMFYVEALTGPGGRPAVADNQAVSVTLTIPKYQSANLAAIHTLTSVYQIANQSDDPNNKESLDIVGGAGTSGPVQLPRGYASRLLYEADTSQPTGLNQGATFNGLQAVSPWGYSTKMLAYVDIPGLYNGSLYPAGQSTRVSGTGATATNGSVVKAYREFELWVGVPAAMSLRMVEKEVDLGAEGHGFAMQQGLLGYGTGGGAYASGFLPTPLYNAAAFPAVGNVTPGAPYSNYMKSFTTQNDGNINLWNLRASQKIEIPTTLAQAGTGQPFQYFGMRSDSVDSRFGILAVGADPLLPFMPQVVTSLDPVYDALWDSYIASLPAFQAQYNGAGSDPYTRYYAAFQGHHTLHKALPGATSPSVLGVPDIPTAQNVYDIAPDLVGQAIPPAPPSSKTVVGVAVPLGTPSGLYHSNLANSPLVVFEDHDTTAAGYNAVPTITPGGGGNLPVLTPAGPLYGGRNNYYFADASAPAVNGAPGGQVPVRTKTGVSDGTLRARRFNDATKKLEYLPYTDPTFDLRVTVKETGLTGQAADRALADVGTSFSLPPVISTGVLPSVDPFPLIQTVAGGNQITSGDLYRAASALTPAAFRSANGSVHVYFVRNAANGVVDTQPGKPYGLFASHLNWNQNLGVFVANNVGVPIAGDARNNTSGRWFTTPSEIAPAGVPAGSSNVTPFVLQETLFGTGFATPGAATLFFMNSTPTVGGAPVNVPYFAPLDDNGVATTAPVPYFTSASPTLQRFAPRAVYVPQGYENFSPNTGTTFLFYYGGVPGRWNIYYSPRAAGTGGTPTDTAANDANGRAELSLSVPTAIVSASDPTPIVRRLYTNGTNNPPVTTIDLYYTGVSRATQTPDVYMTRYELQGGGTKSAGQAARLIPITLPRVYGEKLAAPGRDPLWQARHIAWARNLERGSRAALPRIYLANSTQPNVRREVTDRNNWQYDNASGLLYQTFLFNASVPQSLTTVYIDTSAGTVRFRGAGTPRNTDIVYADYQPQTYRITGDGASNAGTFSLVDQSVLPATPTASVNAILKRTQPMYADRQYILYQKGAQPGKPATLYYSARRVGVDLKTLTTDANGNPLGAGYPIAANETVALSVPTAAGNFNSTPQVSGVTINGNTVPYDVDITNGRIYVAPLAPATGVTQNTSFENLVASFSVTLAKTDGTTRTLLYDGVRLTYLDEKRDVAVPMTQAVNEGQPYAFIDGFVPTVSRPGNNPNPNGDPTLQPGRMWMFWSTPRGREGTVIGPGSSGTNPVFDPFPSAYDVFWQTLAPQFDPLLYTISR